MSFVQVRRLTAGYGKSVVLRGIDLDVAEDESVVVAGKTGTGKSTLLNSFFGGTTVGSGSICIGGAALEQLTAYAGPKHGMTISPQGRLILPHLTVQETLLPGAASNRKGRWTLPSVFELVPTLEQRRHSTGAALGGGQQQLLAVGRALPGSPLALLLGEPSGGLSPLPVDRLVDTFVRVPGAGTGIQVVGRHLNLLRFVTQRFAVMATSEVIDRCLAVVIDSRRHQAALAFQETAKSRRPASGRCREAGASWRICVKVAYSSAALSGFISWAYGWAATARRMAALPDNSGAS